MLGFTWGAIQSTKQSLAVEGGIPVLAAESSGFLLQKVFMVRAQAVLVLRHHTALPQDCHHTDIYNQPR